MKNAHLLQFLLLAGAFCLSVAGAPLARAQAPGTLENGYRNALGQPAPVSPTGVTAPVTGDPLLPAYQVQRQSGTAFGGFPAKGYGTLATNQNLTQPPAAAIPSNYPRSVIGPGVPSTAELRSSMVGRPLALFAVSYNFGAVIPPPAKFQNGVPLAGFYRAEPLNSRLKTTVVTNNGTPVRADKVGSIAIVNGGSGYTSSFYATLSGGGGSGATAYVSVESGEITNISIESGGAGYTAAPAVTFTGGSGTGATAKATLGYTSVVATTADIDGTTTSGGVDALVTTTTAQNPKFYWSKHAQKVFATQAGAIQIQWRESASITSVTETYVIATSPDKPERTIYWTENGFTGPLVEVPEGRVNAVNIIYNSLVPRDVTAPYEPWSLGLVDFAETNPARKRYKTFYEENNLIHAYNVEGRVFVEYLGNPRGDGSSEQKGYEIVNIVKETTPDTLVVDLGEEVPHRPLNDVAGNPVALDAKIIAGLGIGGQTYLHQHISQGGTNRTLYAIRDTQPGVTVDGKLQQVSNEALIYWMETAVLDLQWPKQYLGYILKWPAYPAAYSAYARPDAGAPGGTEASLATAVQLDSANNPALVFQDDPDNSQALLIPGNKFYTKVTQTAPTNRALLRFTRDDGIWFERVYSQLDPYYKNPAPLLERTLTLDADSSGRFSTGFANISNIQVVDADTGTPLVAGVDYTVDALTGVITLVEKQYLESVATLGTLTAGATVAVQLIASSDSSVNPAGNDWDIRSLSLSGTGGSPVATLDFRKGPADFSVVNTGAFVNSGDSIAGPWTWSASAGTWGVMGSDQDSDSRLSSPSYLVPQTGPVTLRLRHRYHTENCCDGGHIRFSVNGGSWQSVLAVAFSTNGYTGNVTNASGGLGSVGAFRGKSAGYDFKAVTSAGITFDAPTLPFSTVPAIVNADIGTRIVPDSALMADRYGDGTPVYVGYIHQRTGTAFNVNAYQDPFVAGFNEAAKGSIIGVNALSGNNQLEVWWYRKSTPRKGTTISGTYWPSLVQKYNLQWPVPSDQIVLAGNQGSGDLPSLEATGEIYAKNNPALQGYNPNEEHAQMLNGRAWALRDDLNQTTSSEPWVLLQYTAADQRPSMHVFRVVRGTFDYPAVAGKVLQSPMPLPLLPPPLLADRSLASYEIPGVADPRTVSAVLTTTDAAFRHYQKFTWPDRKGTLWVYRGPHGGNSVTPAPSLKMRYFYKTQPGFYYPSLPFNGQPAVGTVTPYLRNGAPGAWTGDPVTGEVAGTPSGQRKEKPLDVTFRPLWPDSAPELRVGETLTLPKLGLPQVRGQSSAEFIYQQSMALDNAVGMAGRKASARLFDPTRAKLYPLGGIASPTAEKGNLPLLPASVNTSPFLGKTYFPNLPPHLSSRLYFDPAVGRYGSLIFKGVYMNELVGEKYLQLNVMSAADVIAAKGLTPDDAGEKAKWDAAIDGLSTTMETFVEDPAKIGTFIPLRSEATTPRLPVIFDGSPFTIPAGTLPLIATAPAGTLPGAGQRLPVKAEEPAEIFFGDTAVDSYAVSGSGGGSGYVVLATGNGIDTDLTPEGNPVSLQVFKVSAPLYRGELKVINSSNPLDEKLTLQHTGDFAGHPEEYDFEWRYAPPVDGLPPRLYSFVRKLLAGDSPDWRILQNPAANVLNPSLDYKHYRSPSAVVGNVVTNLNLTNGGSGYASAPAVTIVGGGGSGAAATVILTGGTVSGITLTNRGSGYTSVPTVTFTGGEGSGATAAASTGQPAVSLPGSFVINDGNGTAANGTVLPNALLRRTFSATQRPLRLFVSLALGANDGAVVYLNDAPVVYRHSPGYEDSATSNVPATAPAFDPLPWVFEINPNALVASATPNNNVLTVELFTTADARSTTTFNIRLEGSQAVENLIPWLPVGTTPPETASTESTVNSEAVPATTGIVAVQGKNRHTIQGTSLLTLTDNWIIMRYRARNPANAAWAGNGGWSKWTEPQLAEGWIKRVLAGINPFQQRIKDLFSHQTNTSVSLVEQAGKRWEGDIALNLDSINDSGLIEIYETVLRRGKDLSITGTPAINYGGANDALLLASGYLSDLYMILGNEAYADASNSTIAFNTSGQTAYGDVATSLFSFKGQLDTVLDEELSLLRGQDDSLLPGTQKTPIYNRLIWNYTRGIDSGEAIYALNYNIKDVVWDYSINPNNPGNLPADGVISAADAAVAYPQGHGDAYGHYLTALTGYYGLLNNNNFSWTPRIEAVLVLGTPVSVDYQDERKFAAAAAAVGRAASQTLDLTYRKEFSASENSGWSRLHDAKANPNTGRIRNWGTDDWASRGGQGALFHWVTANSLLPAVDPDPNHSGIQKIDRTTVPELSEIVAQAAAIQQTLDNADAQLNPLGLATGGLTFDISPSAVDAGQTHFEQIHERATSALQNAVSAFNNAKGSTQFLRQQEDTLADQRNAIDSQEQAFTNQLVELYGTPYTDDIGPGRTYKQDYAGPDLVHSQYVDVPELFSDPTGGQKTYSLLKDPKFAADHSDVFTPGDSLSYTLNAQGQLVKPEAWTGRRVSPGRIQSAVSDLLLARQTLQDTLETYSELNDNLTRKITLYQSAVSAYNHVETITDLTNAGVSTLIALKAAALEGKLVIEAAEEAAKAAKEAGVEGVPKSVGLATDASFPARLAAVISAGISKVVSVGKKGFTEIVIATGDDAIERLNFQFGASSASAQFKLSNQQLLYDLHSSLKDMKDGTVAVDASLRHLDQAQRNLYSLQSEGDRIQLGRLVFRQHAAAIVQGYRTRDFAFRAFRDEALERYKSLFDLSARYTYLAARAYDYETGLLDADGNAAAAGFYEKIVRARALGVISDGRPQFAGAESGDPGLSGVLAAMSGDWSVAKTRLGFNNPDHYRSTFSLRQENFRLIPGTEGDSGWKDLLTASRRDNILDDADVRRHAMQAGNPEAFAVPGLVIEFSTTIADGYNFFGKPLAGGDHTFSPTSFATKIRSSGIAFKGYIGMDDPTSLGGALGGIGAVSPADPDLGFNDPLSLNATPYIYLIPAGTDMMRSPPLGDTDTLRAWTVADQAIPLPFNIANSGYSTQPAWVSAASLSEPAFMLRKHQAFRAVPDGTVFSSAPGFTNARLIGRSVWNTRWKIVIPGNTLLNDPEEGLRIFLDTVKDIKLHFETYSYSGN